MPDGLLTALTIKERCRSGMPRSVRVNLAGTLVEHADGQFFAVEGPGAGHTEGNRSPPLLGRKGAVLGPPPFRDVHAGNGLDAVDDRPACFAGKLANRAERAVDASRTAYDNWSFGSINRSLARCCKA